MSLISSFLFNRRREELHARVVRLLRADLKEEQAHRAQLADQLMTARQVADIAEAEAQIAREALTAGHRELLDENQRQAAEIKRQAEAIRLLNRQLSDAMGYGPHELAVIDAGGEQALAAIEKAARTAPPAAAR